MPQAVFSVRLRLTLFYGRGCGDLSECQSHFEGVEGYKSREWLCVGCILHVVRVLVYNLKSSRGNGRDLFVGY